MLGGVVREMLCVVGCCWVVLCDVMRVVCCCVLLGDVVFEMLCVVGCEMWRVCRWGRGGV